MSEADYSARDNTYRKYKEAKLKEDPSWTLEKEMCLRRGEGCLGRGQGLLGSTTHPLPRLLPPSLRYVSSHVLHPQVFPTHPQRRWAPTTWQQRPQHSSRASAAAWSQGSGEERSSETRAAAAGGGGGGHTQRRVGRCVAQHHRGSCQRQLTLPPIAVCVCCCCCCRYVGRVAGLAEGWWVGVAFDEPLGKGDGSAKGVSYFSCTPGHGSFVRPDKVTAGDFPPVDEFSDLGSDDEI